jgi:hypothetical protein
MKWRLAEEGCQTRSPGRIGIKRYSQLSRAKSVKHQISLFAVEALAPLPFLRLTDVFVRDMGTSVRRNSTSRRPVILSIQTPCLIRKYVRLVIDWGFLHS